MALSWQPTAGILPRELASFQLDSPDSVSIEAPDAQTIWAVTCIDACAFDRTTPHWLTVYGGSTGGEVWFSLSTEGGQQKEGYRGLIIVTSAAPLTITAVSDHWEGQVSGYWIPVEQYL